MKAVKAKWLVISTDDVRADWGMVYQDGLIKKCLPNAEIDLMVEAGNLDSTACETGDIVFPGFINTHMHQYGLVSHGMIPRVEIKDFDSFLSDYWWPDIEDKLRREDVLAGTAVSAAELLRSGVVALCDILEAPYTQSDTLIAQGERLEEIGMRGIVSIESSERAGRSNGDRCLEMNREAVRHFKQKGGIVRGAICTHTTFSCSEEFIQKAAEMAKSEGAILQFHLSESIYEPTRIAREKKTKPVLIYESQGALGPNTIASQCVKIDEEEIERLAHYQVACSHMPISNCEVGGGVAPIPRMLEAGLTVGLGTDGYINDFFALMRAAFLIQKAYHERTDIMPARDVFRMATEMGARVIGLERNGSLIANNNADFVVMENHFPTPVTCDNVIDQLVVYSNPGYVKDVYIAGKKVVDNGVVTTMDLDQEKEILRARTEKLWEEQGKPLVEMSDN